MKNYKQICVEIAADVKSYIKAALELGDDSLSYEKYYGTAFVGVEIYQRRVNGWWTTFTDVFVCHEDARHTSPMLTAAIKNAIPEWDVIEREVKELQRYQ